ncbi:MULTISPECIES: NlpC/P60 family protein [unclassified Chelatococcus]|uniref:NlpC/P60 family protein n=1 Tax=unclassified Chelatococcus TaxID=2638111 RepID=UPI001BCE8B17|nr:MULTISPECIES: NlpC/P60 family protein [unclassified Chelatococcus]CAH1669571.1 putative NlpC/P60 family phage cell wall peptidase [Hyphomicrobiales bacterium]MBS7739318.1 C40 family peptidase [Chelatococcus sp. HY11]MBX3546597.1 C40 family peptidase [Chelatococcus sp.]MCO5076148.1 NlpC/P60 family protein [Chelatococcus sp.]CAH1678979.1 putative NlpC/P60 family phage cell wall peptidase [Hyphomicrobiales bacterium]
MSTSPTREQVAEAARGWIGTPYRHQASLRGIGCDCLGLVRGVWRQLYGAEPESPPAYSPDWAEAGHRELLAEAMLRHFRPLDSVPPRPGDVLLFRWRAHLPATHLAIATTKAGMVHAHAGARVAEVALGGWWRRHHVASFSFPEILD